MARGHVQPRGEGTWRLFVYGGTDPDTGRERRITTTIRATSQRAAEKELTKLLARVDRERAGGQRPARTRRQRREPITVAQALTAWHAWAAPNLEPNGAARAKEWAGRYVIPRLGDTQLWRLRPNILVEAGDPDWDPELVSLTAFYLELMTDGGKDGGPLAAATVRRVHAILRSAFDYAVARGWTAANPAIGVRLPKIGRRPATIPTTQGLSALFMLAEVTDPDLAVAMHLMASGARRVDLGLRWSDIDWDHRHVILGARGLITGPGPDGTSTALIRETGTRKRRLRVVALGDDALAALRRHHDERIETALMCGVFLRDDAYVFSDDPEGKMPYRPEWASRAFRRLCAAATEAGVTGVEAVRFYDIRHFMATQLLGASIAPSVVAERMGSSERTLDHHYRHAVPASDREAADVMSRLLSGS